MFYNILCLTVQEKKPNRLFYMPWMAFLPFYMIYESAINIYFFYMAFSTRLENGGTFIVRPFGVSRPMLILFPVFISIILAVFYGEKLRIITHGRTVYCHCHAYINIFNNHILHGEKTLQ